MNKATRVFLVLLRIAVGWHFLYEGVFKIDSQKGGDSMQTSRYYVQAATARLRDAVAASQPGEARAQIAKWEGDVARYFKGRDNPLSEEQKFRLMQLGDELDLMVRNADENADFPVDWYHIHDEVLKLTSDSGQASPHFTSEQYLKASAGPFRSVFRGLVPDADGFERLTVGSAHEALDRRYEELVDHYRGAGRPFTSAQLKSLETERGNVKRSIATTLADPAFRARISDYRILCDRLRREASQVTAPFSEERLEAARKKAEVVASELLAFVNEPLVELTVLAESIATSEQLQAGPPPRPKSQTHFVDGIVQWGLTAIGLCLMLGLFTPFAAGAAAVQLAIFYFASPPWPGLPAMSVGGHYLYVDRNFIEMIAALLLAVSGTGAWAGLDKYIATWRKAAVKAAPEQEPELVEAR